MTEFDSQYGRNSTLAMFRQAVGSEYVERLISSTVSSQMFLTTEMWIGRSSVSSAYSLMDCEKCWMEYSCKSNDCWDGL